MNVLQDWVTELPLMQQSVLLSAVRGADTLSKEHPSKQLLRWYRRCILISAFDRCALYDPYDERGGSFTGPCRIPLEQLAEKFLESADAMPMHFYTHVMHAAEILGYKHPVAWVRQWWRDFYLKAVRYLHLNPETEEQMDRRLGDDPFGWREAQWR